MPDSGFQSRLCTSLLHSSVDFLIVIGLSASNLSSAFYRTATLAIMPDNSLVYINALVMVPIVTDCKGHMYDMK